MPEWISIKNKFEADNDEGHSFTLIIRKCVEDWSAHFYHIQNVKIKNCDILQKQII